MKRCTGHCCRIFTLPYAPDMVWDRRDTLRDGRIIADMVIYLGHDTNEAMFLRHGMTPHVVRDALPRHWYTCRHYSNGNCAIYQQRPTMCRAYPYGHKCEYVDCTAKDLPEEKRDTYNDNVALVVAADHL